MPSASKQKSNRSISNSSRPNKSPAVQHRRSSTDRKSKNTQSINTQKAIKFLPNKRYLAKYDMIFGGKELAKTRRLETLHLKQKTNDETFFTTMNNTKPILEEKDGDPHKIKEINKQIQQKKKELDELEQRIRFQKQNLKLSEMKVKSFESIYTTKMNQIIKGREQIQQMASNLQQKILESQNFQLKLCDRSNKILKQQQELSALQRDLISKQHFLQKFQSQLQSTLKQLQTNSLSLKKRQQVVENTKTQQFAKQIELQSRQSHLQSYVKELNSCIVNLRQQKNNFSIIAAGLEQRCDQLQGIQINIWRQFMKHPKQQKMQRQRGNSQNDKKIIVIDNFKQAH